MMNMPASRRLPIPAALTASLGALSALLLPQLAFAAGPSGGTVVAGSGTITNPSANGTVIKQTSNSAIINWQQFSIGSNDYVQFIQPSASAVVLNRVIGGSPSQILGDLSANGRVFLINPNGVLFGAGAQLDVGGLVASTLNIQDRDFLAGHYVFSGGGGGASVVNAGTIKTADGGFVVLAGDYVKNTGVISSHLGQVVLASGAATTLDLDNSGLISVKVDQATLAAKAGVDNAGQIIADGGRVIMTAKTARDFAGNAVNNTGLVRAQGIANHGGEIELTAEGGDVSDSGTLDASNPSGAGGSIKVTADRDITIAPTAQILASGTTQGGDISIVAQRNLAVQNGALIDAHGTGDHGGQVELSGHAQTTIRGTVTPGSGGSLTIDPTNIVIASGSSGSGSAGGTQTVTEQFVENQLQGNVDVNLVASNSIVMNKLSDGQLNGIGESGYGGSLLLGIGTLNGKVYTEGGGGGISFNSADSIAVYGGLRIDAGSTGGTVNIGNLDAGNININGIGGIIAGNLSSSRGGIILSASKGDIQATSLSTSANGQGAENAAITVSAGGGLNISSIAAGASHQGSNAGSATATVTIDSNTADLGHAVSLGSITAGAYSQPSGSANAAITVTDHDDSSHTVDIGLSGAIVSGANGSYSNGSSTATVSISSSGGISGKTSSIDTVAYGGAPNANITLTANNGGSIALGAITSGGGNVTVNTNGAGGNITLAAVSGIPSYGGLGAVSINAAGSLTLPGDISAASIHLSAGAGDLSLGNLNANNGSIYVSDSGGSIVTGSLGAFGRGSQANADISLYARGGITVGGAITTSDFVSLTTNSTANIDLEANYWSGGSGDLVVKGSVSTFAENFSDPDANVTLHNANGSINLGSNSISTYAQDTNGIGQPLNNSISLVAANGSITAGDLTAQGFTAESSGSPSSVTNGITVQASGTGGNVKVGTLSGGSYGGALSSIDLEAAGTLGFTNNSLSAGSIRIIVGSGDLTKGSLTATNGSIYVHDNGGSLNLGTVSASASGSYGANASVDLFGYSGLSTGTIGTNAVSLFYSDAIGTVTLGTTTGAIQAGQITTMAAAQNQESIFGSSNASVLINGAGAVSVDGISTTATTALSNGYSDAATANVTVSNGNQVLNGAQYTYYGGDVQLGNISTSAIDSDTGRASGYISIQAERFTVGGNVSTGTLTTIVSANGNSADAHVAVSNADGGIDTGGNDIVTNGGGEFTVNDISLTATNGGVSAANLTANGGGITVTTSGSGDIALLTLSGGKLGLGSIDLESAGALSFSNNTLSAGDIRLILASGDLSKGALTATAGGVYVHDTGGSLTVGNVSASNSASYGASAKIDLFGYSGLTAGTITSNAHVTQQYDANASVTLGSTIGAIGTGAISTTALNDNGSGYEGAAYAGVTINGAGAVTIQGISTSATANGVPTYGAQADADVNLFNGAQVLNGTSYTYYGGAVSTGAIKTSAVSGDGAASALVNINANQYSQVGGTLSTGAIQTQAQASGGNSTASVTLNNDDGGIDTGGNAILAQASGGTTASDIKLTGSGGAISAGNLTTTGGAITATTSGPGGNITLGTLSGGSAGLSSVDLEASGALVFTNNTLSAGSITLVAGSGNLSKGTLTATNGSVYVHDNGGSLSLGNVSASASASYGASANVDLFGYSGLTAGTITTNAHVTQYYDADAKVTLGSTTGTISTGAISTTALNDNSGNYFGSANAGVTVNGAGAVTIKGITTSATANGAPQYGASANADVNISNGSYLFDDATSKYSYFGGNLSTGAISTKAVGSNGTASAVVRIGGNANNQDQISGSLTTGAITTQASASGTTYTSITLGDFGGITSGNLSAQGSDITVTNSGSGDIKLGTLSGGAGALGAVDLESVGALATASTSITAGSIRLIAGSGAFSIGALTATNGGVYVHDNGGSLNLGKVSASASASYGASADVDLFGYSGLTAGTITTNAHVTQYYDAQATVTLGSSTGAISTGAISTTALNDNGANYAGAAYAGVSVGGAGAISIASIQTSATANGKPVNGSSAAADIDVSNGGLIGETYYGGTVDIGAITTTAVTTSGNASGHVFLTANDEYKIGGTMTLGAITTSVSGVTSTAPIQLHNYDGAIQAGALTADGSGITVTTSGLGGNIALGALSGGSAGLSGVDLEASGALSTSGAITANSIYLSAGAGNLSFGALTSTNGNLQVADTGGSITGTALTAHNGSVVVNAYSGDITLGDIKASGSSSEGDTAQVGIYSGGGLKVGSVSTDAEVSGNSGDATGNISLNANYHADDGGLLQITGAISAKAVAAGNGLANASVYIANSDGGIAGGSNSITTTAGGGGSINSNIDLHAYNSGAISIGNLTATGGSISVSNQGSGNITVGTLSGGSGSGLQDLYFSSAGGLDLGTQALTALSVSLTASNGDLKFGNLTVTAGNVSLNDTGGIISGGDITTLAGYIHADAYSKGITLGNLSTTDAGTSGADGSVDLYSGGGLQVGSITTKASTSGSGQSVSGNVDLHANYHAQSGGDLVVTGPISANANGGAGESYGNAGVTLINSYGSIDTSAGAITASGSGGTHNSAINIASYIGGGVLTGALTATDDSITVTSGSGALGNGDISLGTLSGGGAGHALTSVYLVSAGGLTVNSAITAPTVTLGSAAGLTVTGDIDVTKDDFFVNHAGGDISLKNVSALDSISIYNNGASIATGDLTVSSGGSITAITYNSGNIVLGHLSAGSGANALLGDVNIGSAGALTIGTVDGSGNPTAVYDITASSLSLGAGAGLLSAGNLTTTNGSIILTNSGGAIAVGNLSTSAANASGGADGSIIAYAAGGITVGSISTSANAGGTTDGGFTLANGSIAMEANSGRYTATTPGGSLTIKGPIVTLAVNSGGSGNADGSVSLYNGAGGIGTKAISTGASAANGSANGGIGLNATNGDIVSGALTAIDGADIYVNTSKSGNISVGQLAAAGDGELNILTLTAASGLTTNGTNLRSQQLDISAANGDLSVGDIQTDLYGIGVADYGGKMTLGNLFSAGTIALYETAGVNGGVHTGNLRAADNIFITTSGNDAGGLGASVSVGTLSANEGTLGTVDVESSGGIEVGRIDGSTSHAATIAGIVTLNGALKGAGGATTTGNLTATYGDVTVSGANGDMNLGTVIADGNVKLSNANGNITTQDLTTTGGYTISATTTGSGSIKVGSISGSSYGSLASVLLQSAGGLAVGATGSKHGDISASAITLSAANGDLSAGNIKSTTYNSDLSISDSNGTMTLLSVTALGSITLSDSGGGINAGALHANLGGASVTVTATGSGANVKLGTIGGGSSDAPVLAAVDLEAGGTLHSDSQNLTAGILTLSAGAGTLSFGALKTTQGTLSLGNSGGGISVASLDSYGNIGITAQGALKVGGLTSLGDGGEGALSITSGSVNMGELDNNSALNATGPGNDMYITATAGDLTLGAVKTLGTGTVYLDLVANSGVITTQDINLEILNAQASGNVKLGNLTLNSLTPGGPSNLISTGGTVTALGVTSNHGLYVSGNNGVSLGDVNVVNSLQLLAAGGGIGTGSLGDGNGSIIVNNSAGTITTGALTAGGDIDLTASGLVTVNGTTSLGNAGNGALSVTGSAVKMGDLVNNSPLEVTISANDMSIIANSGGIVLGNVSTAGLGTVFLTLTATANGGTINTGNLDLQGVNISAQGNVTTGEMTLDTLSSGVVATTISSGDGVVKAGDIHSDHDLTLNGGSGLSLGVVAADGLLSLNNVNGLISTGDLSSRTGEVLVKNASGAVQTGDITAGSTIMVNAIAGSGNIAVGNLLSAGEGGLSVVSLDAGGSISVNKGSGNITAGQINLAAGNGDLAAGNLDSTGAGSALTVSDTKGKITLGNLTAAGNITVSDGTGGISIGNIAANRGGASISVTSTGSGANITLGSLSGGSLGAELSAVTLTSGGSLSSATANLGAGTITLAAGSGLLSFGALQAGSGGLSLNNTGGGIKTGILVSSGALSLNAAGAVNTGAIGAASVEAQSSGGAAVYGDISSPGAVNVVAKGGDLSIGNINALTLTTNVDTGNEKLGNVTIGGSNLLFALGDVAGQSLTVGNLTVTASFNESLACTNCSLHFGDIDVAGGFTVNLTNGSFSGGSITTGGGDINLASAHGSLAFGNLTGADISLSTGQALTLSGNKIQASEIFSLSAGDTSLGGVTLTAGTSASLTSAGKLSIDNSSVQAPSVALNATGDIDISGNSDIGSSTQGGNLAGGPVAHDSGTPQLGLSSGGNISIDHSTLSSGQLSLNGDAIQLANGAALAGTAVVLTGTGAVGSGAGSSTVNAGALSVKGASIDFSSASLTVGTGIATFGGDTGLLDSIRAKNPGLLPTSNGPNASFAAPGGVTLGKLSIAGGYLFIQAPSLDLPGTLSGNSNMFVDYLPTNPTATLNVSLPKSLAGVTTLAIGGTPQTGDIVIGDGTEQFILNTPTNFVFATSGTTRYPNNINTSGVVLVLGQVVDSTPPVQPSDLPLPPDQYTIDQPDPGTLAFGKDPGDINDPGVSEANKGRIDITTSTQSLSCGIGGVQ